MKQAGRVMLLASALAGAALGAAPLAAQDASEVVGWWNGTVEEGEDYYQLYLTIDLDKDGRPVGNVSYTTPCHGVWAAGTRQGRGWRFDETITDNRDLCAAHVTAVVARSGDELEVRLSVVGEDGVVARGTLYRVDELALDAAADAVEEAADAAEGDYLSAIAWCNPGETGIEFGQAAGEGWFVDSDPIRVNGRRYVKYGLPRMMRHADLSSYSIYADAGVLVEPGTQELQPEMIYVLVRAPSSPDNTDECEYQAYSGE